MRRRRASRALAFILTGVVVLLLIGGCGGRKRLAAGGAVDEWSAPTEEAGGPVLLRVGLDAGCRQVVVGWDNTVVLRDGERRELARFGGGAEVVARHHGGRVFWTAGGRSGETDALVVQPLDPEHLLLHAETHYPGEILFLPLQAGLSVINQVELQTYLRGVVPWEIGRPGREAVAAVAAQAVAARTYTIAHLRRQQEFGFDVWCDVRDQVYRGADGLDPVCDEAIERTRGLVLRSDGHEIEAYYSSTCGGVTSNVEEVWPRESRPYLRSIPDSDRGGSAFCGEARYAAWTERWGGVELEAILVRTLPAYVEFMRDRGRGEWAGTVFEATAAGGDYRRPGALLGLEIVSRTTSGRIGRLDVRCEAGVYHLRGDRVRWVLTPGDGDPVILRSAFFDLEVDTDGGGWPESIVVRGRGFGHGIGLCQTGALARARSGQDFREILAAYYPGAELFRIAR